MRRLLGSVLLALAVVLPTANASAIIVPPPFDIVAKDCLELTPQAVHVPVVKTGNNDGSRIVDLDVFLVGDRGVTKAQAKSVLADAQPAFTPMNVQLKVAGFRSANLSGRESQSLIDQTKALFGGERPEGSDMVWTLTPQDIYASGVGDAVIGQADCIGGVRYSRHAFLVGEYLGGGGGFGLGPIWFMSNFYGKLFAHETGHLLGAHHHVANCVEGIPTEVGPSRVEVSPCTLMTNVVDFSSINFSTANTLVSRAHAEEWAD